MSESSVLGSATNGFQNKAVPVWGWSIAHGQISYLCFYCFKRFFFLFINTSRVQAALKHSHRSTRPEGCCCWQRLQPGAGGTGAGAWPSREEGAAPRTPGCRCCAPQWAACPSCSCPGGWAQPGGCSCGLPGDRDQTSSDKAHEVGWLLVNYLRKACWHFWGSTCICKKDYKSVCSLWLPSDKSFCFDTWGLQSSSFL